MYVPYPEFIQESHIIFLTKKKVKKKYIAKEEDTRYNERVFAEVKWRHASKEEERRLLFIYFLNNT